MRIIPSWLREFVDISADDRQLAEDLTSAGIAVESVQQENGQTVYEMDLTTNRVDAMNHYGVAREASAIYDRDLKRVQPLSGRTADPFDKLRAGSSASLGMTNPEFPIVIEDPHGCARYTARIVRKVKIGPSPAHIVKRLELLGSRSINNAADATNYALNELGHPTHAFDLDLLEGGTIIVRRARAGEALKTLDGVDRKLTTEDLVIADARKPVALAGVMGGFDTMITDRTKNVLIESAWFEPWTVRSMAKRHGMHTDASHRFERGADYGIAPLACDRVAELILESAGGELHGGLIDAVGRKLDRLPIPLRRSEIKRNLGIDIRPEEVDRILRRLGFKATRDATDDLSVQVPTWRLDVERQIDLLEELARIYGYNNFPNTLPAFTGGVVELPDEPKNAKVRETMLALGYDEAISITFIAEADAKAFLSSADKTHSSKRSSSGVPDTDEAFATEPLGVANPLNEESAYMRTSLLPGLINMVAYNLNRGTTNVRLFESGDIFEKLGERHDERRHLGFAATGDAISKSVHTAAQSYTFFHMKGDIVKLLSAFAHQSLQFDSNVPAYLHPGRSARVVMDGQTVAVFGQLHPEQASARKLKQEVYVAEIMLDRLYQHRLREPRYQRISKFPAVGRDFSFVFEDAVTFERIQSAISELGLNELQSFIPAEIYRGEKVGAGKYSVLLHAEFQSQERTLRDDEVAQWSAQIISKLEAIGGVLRAQ
jgi:phenylalanyl-tRNA synthetase beta chain